jgi:Bacterial extracellular solute-binding protein
MKRHSNTGSRWLAAAIAMTMMPVHASHAVTFNDLYRISFGELNTRVYKALGSLRICAANELKPWIANDVIPAFKGAEKGLTMSENDLVFNGSGELANNLNEGNKDRCDIVIFGSDVAGQRATDFERTKAVSLAYSPTVFVGVRDKLRIAREALKKGPDDPLSCSDLAQIAKKGRVSRLKAGAFGKLTVEMSTSNSGQTGYLSCVYSELNAESPKEVDEVLQSASGEQKQSAMRDFMSTVVFEQASSSKVKDLFISGEGQGVGAAHLVIATYESYLPEITKAAEANNIELETIYLPVSILSNFPAYILAKDGTAAFDAAKAFLQTATSTRVQQQLIKYGLRPAAKGITLAPYMNMKIEVGDSPRNRKDLRRMWDVVGKIEQVKSAGILDFPY